MRNVALIRGVLGLLGVVILACGLLGMGLLAQDACAADGPVSHALPAGHAKPAVRMTTWPGAAVQLARGLLAVTIGVALGAIVLLFRTILPGVARAADASVARLSTKRLLLAGLLPLLGIGLVGKGLDAAGIREDSVVAAIFALALVIPAALLMVAGLCAALLHLGRTVLRAQPEPSPLAAGLTGGLLVGLAAISMAWPPLGVLVAMLFSAWLLGIGVGTLVRPKA